MARFFVNRPIVAIVLSIIMVLLGFVAMQGLPIAQYPEIVPPMVQVTTTFIGASATDVEASVATPLEQKINGVEKGIYMRSPSRSGRTRTWTTCSRRTVCPKACRRCRSRSRTTASR
jgi:HAE1 family hydrophobic/amphiphilic exporter-1